MNCASATFPTPYLTLAKELNHSNYGMDNDEGSLTFSVCVFVIPVPPPRMPHGTPSF